MRGASDPKLQRMDISHATGPFVLGDASLLQQPSTEKDTLRGQHNKALIEKDMSLSARHGH